MIESTNYYGQTWVGWKAEPFIRVAVSLGKDYGMLDV